MQTDLMKAFIDNLIKPLAENANSAFESIIAHSDTAVNLAAPLKELSGALGLVKPHVAPARAKDIWVVLEALKAIEPLVAIAQGGFLKQIPYITCYHPCE